MNRSLAAIAAVTIAAHQAAAAFTIAKAPRPDVNQETLIAVDPQSTQATEVFPGAYESPVGAAVMSRVETIMGRVDDADRRALDARKVRAGFDRSIVGWRANGSGETVALALRYYRQPLFDLELEVTDDYGRADPVDPFRYEFLAIAVCNRRAAAWSCTEEPIADVARRLKVTLPQDRAGRLAAAEWFVERLLAGK
jgi:hypothetical protein